MARLFHVFIPTGVLVLLVSETLLIATSFVLGCYLVLYTDPTVFLLADGGWVRVALVTLSILLGLHFQDLYSNFRVRSRIGLFEQLCLVMGMAFIAQGLVSYLSVDLRTPIRVVIAGGAIAIAAMFGWRVFYSRYARHIVGAQRLLLAGGSSLLEEIAAYLVERPELGIEVAGYVDDTHPRGTRLAGASVLGPLSDLKTIAQSVAPDRIIVGMRERRGGIPVADLLDLRLAGMAIEEAATTFESMCGRVCVTELRPSQLIYSSELGPRPHRVFWQTLGNYVIAVAGTILFLPVMLLTALAVKLESPGPVLYRQKRVGLDGAAFTVFKFRSMRANAEASTGAVWAAPNDPRVTRVGRLIRRLRFDELPQFFNVLRGEMSIVGPRPERPEFVEALTEQIPFYGQRHCVRPGITGWAQINHRYGDTIEDTVRKLEYDLYYIKNLSQRLDTYIIFHTLKTMLLSRGAQ